VEIERAAAPNLKLLRRHLEETLAALALVVAPPACHACGRRIEVEAPPSPPLAWCAACAGGVVPLGERFCLDCPPAARRWSCSSPGHLRLLAAVQYGDAVAALVRATKYQGLEGLLDTWLAVWRVAAGEAAAAALPELLVPVPVHPVRARERGYPLPERWAARLAAWHGVARAAALVRWRATRPQVGLDREARRRNVAGAMGPGAEWRAVAGRRVALVDDVATSGATAREAADLLRSLGARDVELWCFAHEPLE
jgi:ComF family protein